MLNLSKYIQLLKLARDQEAWEAVCNKCGECCFNREYDENDEIDAHYDQPCEFLNVETRECTAYEDRLAKCKHCRKVTPYQVALTDHMPKCCAYLKL